MQVQLTKKQRINKKGSKKFREIKTKPLGFESSMN